MSKTASAPVSEASSWGAMPTIPDNATVPLGFAAFVVALLFAYAAKHSSADSKWMRPLIYIVGIAAVGGGGFLFWTHDQNVTRTAAAGAASVPMAMASSSLQAYPQSPAASQSAPSANVAASTSVGTNYGVVQGVVQHDVNINLPAAAVPASPPSSK